MAVAYFRRFRMEIDLGQVNLSIPVLPKGYTCVPWDPSLLDRHAFVKFQSFHGEIDARVFRCLGELDGCQRLMGEIASQKGFLPLTTWLITFQAPGNAAAIDCGTIQGLAHSTVLGAIQNVGVIPSRRGCGLGRALLLKSLDGFRQSGMRRVYLEVTAKNKPAIGLYRSLGFRLTRTMYKAAEVPEVQVC